MAQIGLKTSEGKQFYFNESKELRDKLNECMQKYNRIHFKHYKNCYIKTAYSNNAISGYLTVADTLNVIATKNVKNKEQKTVLNTIGIIEGGLLETKGFSNEYIIKIWSLLNNGALNYMKMHDCYRKQEVRIGKGVVKTTIAPTYVAPHYSKVPEMMNDLVNFANRTDINPLLQSIAFSMYFVYVHPFLDGNGRTSRLLMTKLLVDKGMDKFRYLSITSSILKYKREYMLKLKEIEQKNNGDITSYIDLMLTVFERLFDLALQSFYTSDVDTIKGFNKRQQVMLQYMIDNRVTLGKKEYKKIWNSIAGRYKMDKIAEPQALNDLIFMLDKDILVLDRNYTLYDGYKYWRY